MSVVSITSLFGNFEPVLCLVALACLANRKALGEYKYLSAFLATRLLSFLLAMPLLLFGHSLGLSPARAYNIYLSIYWSSYAIEALLGFGIIFSVFHLAMAPLKGLQNLGMMMFRWAGAISLALALTIALGPHVTTLDFFTRVIIQLQQTQSVLTLCMLLFVCFAIHPMGLSYRSRIFGVSLGLGILATTDLVQAAWISHTPYMYSVFSLVNGIAICFTLIMWSVYFVVPEPKRRMIVLPTTSPFLRWNQISQVLGDDPGFVALGEVTSDMFAPAEIEVMRRASRKMESALIQ